MTNETEAPELKAALETHGLKTDKPSQLSDAFRLGWNTRAARIAELEAKLAKAVDGLRECEQEIDAYIRQEYPHDHPVQERYRQRDFAANPARATLAELKGTDQ